MSVTEIVRNEVMEKLAGRKLPYSYLWKGHTPKSGQFDEFLQGMNKAAANEKTASLRDVAIMKVAARFKQDEISKMDPEDLGFLRDISGDRDISEVAGEGIRQNRIMLGGASGYGAASAAGALGKRLENNTIGAGEEIARRALRGIGKRRAGLGLTAATLAMLSSGDGREIADDWNANRKMILDEIARRRQAGGQRD